MKVKCTRTKKYDNNVQDFKSKKYKGHRFATTDIDFIEKNKICPSKTIEWLKETKDCEDPLVCLEHRRIQEEMRDIYKRLAEQDSWNKNNSVIHTFTDEHVKFNK